MPSMWGPGEAVLSALVSADAHGRFTFKSRPAIPAVLAAHCLASHVVLGNRFSFSSVSIGGWYSLPAHMHCSVWRHKRALLNSRQAVFEAPVL